jgi:hypothetical protein
MTRKSETTSLANIEICNTEEIAVMGVKRKSFRRRKSSSRDDHKNDDHGGFLRTSKPSVYHAVVVIFLEFFAWGLLTTPMLTVLK